MRLSLEQKTLLGFFIALMILLIISMTSIHFVHRQNMNERWVEHTQLAMETLQACRVAQLEVEAGMQGFVLSGNVRSWSLYQEGAARFQKLFDLLDPLISDDAAQEARLSALRQLLAEWIHHADHAMIHRSQKSTAQDIAAGPLTTLSVSIHRIIEEMWEEEKSLLAERAALEARSSQFLTAIIVFGSLIAIALVGLASVFIHRDIHARQRAEAKLRQNEERLLRQTQELQAVNTELESFSYSVSHDLRAPLRGIEGFSQVIQENYQDRLDAQGQAYFDRVRAATRRMGQMIDDILNLSRITRKPMRRETVDLAALGRAAAEELQRSDPQRRVAWRFPDSLIVEGDAHLLGIMLQNLLGNAWKFTGKKAEGIIELGRHDGGDAPAYFVRDNGAGFDMAYQEKLFEAFQRLHAAADFPGTGIGLATVQRIVRRHGGHIWARGAVDEGAAFYFTLSSSPLAISLEGAKPL